MNSSNKAIEDRWARIKEERFNNLTFSARLSFEDIACSKPEAFFDPDTFAEDLIGRYECQQQLLPVGQNYIRIVRFDNSDVVPCFANNLDAFLSPDVLSLIYAEVLKKGECKELLLIGQRKLDRDFSHDSFEVEYYPFTLAEMLMLFSFDEEEKERYKAIEQKYKAKIDHLYAQSYADFLKDKEYRAALIKFIVDYIGKNQEYYRDNCFQDKLLTFFDSDPKNEYLSLSFVMLYTDGCAENMRDFKIDIADYTYATIPMFKFVEKLLYRWLLEKHGDDIYKDARKIKDMDEKEMMLTGMASYLSDKKFIGPDLNKSLRTWINADRNGYSHKHLMDEAAYEECRKNSFGLIVRLVNDLF